MDRDVGVGVYTDQDLLLPTSGGGGAAEGDPASAIISKSGHIDEKGSLVPSSAAAECGPGGETSSSSSSSNPGADAAKIKGASGEGCDDVGGAASSGVGSSTMDSPPGILTDSADGNGGGGGGGALPEGIQEALRVSRAG